MSFQSYFLCKHVNKKDPGLSERVIEASVSVSMNATEQTDKNANLNTWKEKPSQSAHINFDPMGVSMDSKLTTKEERWN